ncbi:MAG TPA: DUF1697 domain-containing protein [Anaeromyxobacteraceae bacterium]|nr:DUF1697 domain-containing protein [Anaeromyxobacteraceae bacterium]
MTRQRSRPDSSPSRHVALLRGINVGGSNVIRMAALRSCFEKMGFTEVETLIQSGNVVFASKPLGKAGLTREIEEALSDAFGYASRVVLVSAAELERIVAQAPAGFGTRPQQYRYDVVFVKEPLTAAEALEQITAKPGVDTVNAGDGALYFRRLTSKAAQSHLSRVVQRPVYQSLTIRNWNTTTRLLAMARRGRP